jgi:hypothetical protein
MKTKIDPKVSTFVYCYYLLYTGVALHVSTFAMLSSAESQEYETVLELSCFNTDPHYTILVLFLIVEYCNVEQYYYNGEPFVYVKTNTRHFNSTHV